MISFGYMVWCCYEDGFREPEGVVTFPERPPVVGDTMTLCDGCQWEVLRVDPGDMELDAVRDDQQPAGKEQRC